MKNNNIESCVIVKNEHGFTATLRFTDPTYDRLISANSHSAIDSQIDAYIKKVLNG